MKNKQKIVLKFLCRENIWRDLFNDKYVPIYRIRKMFTRIENNVQ